MTMDIGLIFAIVSAICFAAAQVTVRRGLFHAETALGAVFITVPLGALSFTGLLIATAQYQTLWHIPWHVFVLFGMVGVINFIGGRLMSYTGIQLLGANRNATIMRTIPFWAVILGVLFLDEALTVLNIVGIVLVVGGATLVSVRHEDEPRALQLKGVAASLGGALCFAVSAVLIRAVIKEAGSPITAAFIAFMTASIVLGCLLSRENFKQQLFKLQRRSIIPYIIAGIFGTIAQFFRYNALNYTPVSLVEPVLAISVVFVLIFSFFINRNIEIFSINVIMGIISSAIGTALIFI